MPEFTIRPAGEKDAESILQIAARMADNGIPPWRDRGKALAWHHAEALHLLETSHPESRLLVAEMAGEVTGFIYFFPEQDFLTGEQQGYIAGFAVSAAAEGHGVGSALLREVEVWCREKGFRVLTLDVFAANSAARAFYARRGFQEQTLKMARLLTGTE